MVEDGHIKYSRKGGYFVTTKKALFYLVVTVSLSLTVGLLVYQYGPHKETEVIKHQNIEEILNITLKNMPKQDIRLSQNVRPQHYKLMLKPNVDDLTFYGEVSITIRSTDKAKYIVLNVDDLDLHNISLVSVRNAETHMKRSVEDVPVGNISQNVSRESSPNYTNIEKVYDVEAKSSQNPKYKDINHTISKEISTEASGVTAENYIETIPNVKNSPISEKIHILSRQIDKVNLRYTMHLSIPLHPEKAYILNISFTGKISDALQGLHQNIYTNNEGKKQYTIISHLQPVFARKVFPCFDEPSMKAAFEITILHKENMISLSNMPLKEKNRRDDGWIEDNFEVSPPMPPYLLAIVLLDLEYSSTIIRDFNTSIWAPEGHLEYATHPLSNTAKILKHFGQYFNVTYPLPKLDFVAIPTLVSTATENWGLVLYKESALLNGMNDRETFLVLAKKLAQQWFGNLVSIEWWDDLWQIKGFALLMADEAVHTIRNWTSQFSLTTTQRMLALDDFKTAPKLHVEHIKNTFEISELFDSTRHYKGSCLLRMLKNSLPEDLFRKGIREFLKKWEYKSANQYDFWNSINDNTKEYLPNGKNITEIMTKWTTQAGYPLITVIRDHTNNTLNITQTKFQHSNISSDNNLWIVPLNYIIGDSEEHKLWLTNRSITVSNVSGDKWILFNVKRTGYYRVNYDESNWNLLIKTLNANHSVIPIDNRGQLINDAFKLAENGLLDFQVAFNLTTYLHKETDYIPWASVLESLDFIKRILQSTYLNGAYEDYVINLVSDFYDQLRNNNSTDHSDQQLKRLIITTACDVNYKPCIEWARHCFKDWTTNSIPIPYALRQTVYCSVIKHGGKAEWESLWKELKAQKSNSDIQELFMGLGCTRDTWLINKYMRHALNGEIPWQYVPYVWKSLSQPTSIAFGFKYLRENWDTIYQTYKDKPFILSSVVKNFLYALSSKSDLEDLTILVSKHQKDLQQLATLIQGAVDRIRIRVAWSDMYLDRLDELLSH